MAFSRCHGEKGLRSLGTNDSLNIRIGNDSSNVVEIYWIDFNGKRKLYDTVSPGDDFNATTYRGHPWVVTDEDGNCLTLITPNRSDIDTNVSD